MGISEIKEALEYYGLTYNEIKIYIFLLTRGRNSAGVIAKETQMDRSSCYETLKKLMKKGLVKFSIEVKTRYFEIADPEVLIELLNEKEDKIKSVMQNIKELYKEEKQESVIKLYRGYNGLKAVFLDIIKEGKDYYVLDSSGQFVKRMPYFAEHFIRELEKKKIKVKHIVRRGIDIHPSKTTEVRFFSKKIPLTTGNTTIYGDKIAIFLWKQTPEVIIIEDKATSELYKDYFEILWKNVKK